MEASFYSPPYFFILNPFVEDIEASISQRFLVEGTTEDGRSFRYQILESIYVPSGLCNIELEEKLPNTEYETALSLDGQYEYLTSQREVLETYKNHPITLFAQEIIKQFHSVSFRSLVKEPSLPFSNEPLPAGLDTLPIVQKCQELFASCDAVAFHNLTLGNALRENLGIKD